MPKKTVPEYTVRCEVFDKDLAAESPCLGAELELEPCECSRCFRGF